MATELRVVIPTAGRPVLLERTLKSLAQCVFPPNYRETIVAANGPELGAGAIVAGMPERINCRYVPISTPGKSNALNVIIDSLPEGCLVVFLDDDVRLSPDLLLKYADAAKEAVSGSYYGGPTRVDFEHAPPQWLLRYLPASAAGWHPDDSDHKLGDGIFLGFNWAAFAGDIRRAGMFDISLGPGTKIGAGDEPDIQRRLQRNGVASRFVGGAVVWHYVPKCRCTPAFALRRYFQTAVLDGRRLEIGTTRTVFGFPRDKLRVWLRRCGRCVWAQFDSNVENRFSARYYLVRKTGLMLGMRDSILAARSRSRQQLRTV